MRATERYPQRDGPLVIHARALVFDDGCSIELVCELPGSVSFVLIPVSLLSYVVASLVVLGMAVYSFIKERPRSGTSVLLMLLLPVLLWWPINWAADVVHIELTTRFGVGQFGAPSKSSDGRFEVYDWSVGLAGANRFLIHDVTDEITLPVVQHTHPLSSENGFGEECAGKVQRLIGHYYICSF